MPEDGRFVVYNSPHVPAEWIAAHGWAPCRLTPSGREETDFPGMGVCPYAAAFVQEASVHPGTAAVVMTTACDQMRRLSEAMAEKINRPVFLMHLPAAVETPTAFSLYREEVMRLGRFLERLGGTAPETSEVTGIMSHYDAARRALLAARDCLKPRIFADALIRFQHGDWTTLDRMEPESIPRPGIPVALAGGPLRSSDLVIFDEVEAAGGWVAIDATSTGERTLAPPFEKRLMEAQPLEELLKAYWRIPEAYQRPNTALYRWYREAFTARDVRGVIFRHYVWCDTWQVEVQRLRESIPLPLLELDAAEELDSARQKGRIQAFLESLA